MYLSVQTNIEKKYICYKFTIIMRNIKYDDENKKIHFYVIHNRISKKFL